MGMFMARSTSFITGICWASSSGIPWRVALYCSYFSWRKVGPLRSKATQRASGFSSWRTFSRMFRKP